MKVLITGGAGFIGSHLADRLLQREDEVFFADLSTGSFDNIRHLKRSERFHYFLDSIELVSEYGRYGYRRITIKLHEAGWQVGKDRVQRIWRREGLKVPMSNT